MQERLIPLPAPRFRLPFPRKNVASPAALAWRQAVPVEHRAADERLLAFARMIGAGVLVAATPIDPLHTDTVHALVDFYATYAALSALASALRPAALLRFAPLLHGVDLVWAIVATMVTGGVASNMFPVFTYLLLSSAYRWGLRGVVRDAMIILLAVLVESFPWFGVAAHQPQLHILLVRVAYIGIGIGLLFGVVLQRQHVLGFQSMMLAEIVSHVTKAPRLDPAIKEVLKRLLRLFDARHVLLVIEETHTGVLQRWRADTRVPGSLLVTQIAIPREDRGSWLMAAAGIGACELRRSDVDAARATVAATLDGDRCMARLSVALPSAIANASAWQSLLAVPVTTAGVWRGHLYLVDPVRSRQPELRLRFLQDIVQQVGPALVNLYLLRRLRSRAESIERGRISRELHDGALPALVGLEMRVESLCRSTVSTVPNVAADLLEIRDQLRDEAVNLRGITERLRSADVDARGLPGELADHVARFGRTTAIDARFEWSVDELQISPHFCGEIVRIVQEALFNIRRHAAATRVIVRVEADASSWILAIADNGRGLGFTGRLTDRELRSRHSGPRVIHQRVAALGGTLDVESSPAGTRLEMTFARDPMDA